MSDVVVRLPRPDGTLVAHRLRRPVPWVQPAGPARTRTAFAAAHVVADPFGDTSPGAPAAVDWDATLAFRHHLWSYGLGVAEAMDTAQRGMGLDWPTALELVRRSATEARAVGGRIVAGVATDHAPAELPDVDAVVAAWREQLDAVQDAGAQPVVMASRQLARLARGPEDYAEAYGHVLAGADQRVVVHWLGPMFDPALAGYWGSTDLAQATETFLAVVRENAAHVDGVKVSLLDADHERTVRAALPDGVRLYTGDDFNYPELIRGDGTGHSHALLGAFAAIAPAAAAALAALDAGDLATYDAVLAPTLPLSRQVFAAPTQFYKAGIAFLAWVSGHQRGFTMLGGLQSARSLVHLGEVLRLADVAGLLPDPALAAARFERLLQVGGAG
ncbi:MAG: dihydrodipicolinate synthase family protein [Motilibacteraceae bacterium]